MSVKASRVFLSCFCLLVINCGVGVVPPDSIDQIGFISTDFASIAPDFRLVACMTNFPGDFSNTIGYQRSYVQMWRSDGIDCGLELQVIVFSNQKSLLNAFDAHMRYQYSSDFRLRDHHGSIGEYALSPFYVRKNVLYMVQAGRTSEKQCPNQDLIERKLAQIVDERIQQAMRY